MQKFLEVKQMDSKDCGASCLLSIIRYYKGNISLEKLSEMTKTNKFGTTFFHLKETANELGFEAECFKNPDKELTSKIILPCICHMKLNNYEHFCCLYKVSSNNVLVMDPAFGFKKISTVQFKKDWTGNILILTPIKKIPYIKDEHQIKRTIYEVLLQNKKIIINIFCLSVIFTIFTCLYSFYFKIIIDTLMDNQNIINIISIAFLFIGFIKIISNYYRNQLLIYLNQKIDISIVLKTLKQVVSLPYQYYKNKTTGEVISRINDLGNIRTFVSKLAMTLFVDIILVIIGILFLSFLNKKLFFISLLNVLFYLLIILIFKKATYKSVLETQIKSADVNSYLYEVVGGFETIKALNFEDEAIRKIDYKYSNLQNHLLKFDNLNNIIEFLTNFIDIIFFILLIYSGINEVIKGTMTIGSLIFYNSLLSYFLNPLKNLISMNIDYYLAKSSFRRVEELYNIDKEDLKSTNNLLVKNDINIKDLEFSYNDKDKILNKVNLQIKEKDRVLILGSSGSGKSTLLKILYKYFYVKRGMISFGDIDINDFTIRDIRRGIIYVSQNETLYTDTIYNNIVMNRDIPYAKFIEICKLLKVDEIIENKILGYDMMLEENGVNISGGQRQRIILARALLQDGNIILLDEALNALDINLERYILKSLFKNYPDKTFIIVSHRRENIDLFDQVIELNNGSVSYNNSKNKGGIHE